MRKILITGASLFALVVGSAGVAVATPAGAPEPSQTATAQAGSGLYRACSHQGFKGLYTPIPVGTAPVADAPGTPYDESKATVYTLRSRNQCKAVADVGGALGLLKALPSSTVAIQAPENFPTPPRTTPAPTPATVTLANVVNGSASAPFTLNVVGANFTPNADLSALVTYRDGRAVVIAVGKTNATGGVSYPVAGACVNSQVPSSITLLQYPSGPAATVAVPAAVCG